MRLESYFTDAHELHEKEAPEYCSTVPALLEFCERTYGEKPALQGIMETISYRMLSSRVARRRAFLYETGIPTGETIGVIGNNTIDTMELALGILSAGFCLLLLPVSQDAASLSACCRRFHLRGLFAAPTFSPLAKELSLPVFPINATADHAAPPAAVSGQSPAAIFFTGGTTSAPKGAILSHSALMQGAFYGCYLGAPFRNRHSVALLPLSHIFGAVVGFLSLLYTGTLLFPCEDIYQSLNSLPQIRPTNLLLVPGLLEALLTLADSKGAACLGGLQSVTCGGAPMSPALVSRAAAYGIKVHFGYGMTENASVISVNYCCEQKPLSVGKLFTGQEIRFVDGEIQLKGGNLMSGYYEDPISTSQAFQDGWFRTGDVGWMDEEGFLFLTGRKKNLIILSNGENVCPEELEQLLYQSPLVKECVVGETEAKGKQVIGAEIFPSETARGITPEALLQALRQLIDEINRKLPAFKQISAVSVREEPFPKNRAMKIIRGMATDNSACEKYQTPAGKDI